MNIDHAAELLATAAVAATGNLTIRQCRAAVLVADALAAAWDAGLRRDDVAETYLFKGTTPQRLASARVIVSAIPAEQLAEIFRRYAPPSKS